MAPMMATSSNEEKGLLGSARTNSHRRYGSTTVNMKKPEHIVRHKVSKQDTLQGIALRYGVTMECVKQHNKLWSSESMFLHDFLEVPVTKEIYDIYSDPCLSVSSNTSNGGREFSLDVGSESCSSTGPSSLASSPLPQDVTPSTPTSPTRDYSDTLPKDFLSKIDSNIASMKSSIQKFDAQKYKTMDQMEVDESCRRPSLGSRQALRSPEHRRSLDVNGGFPVKSGSFLNDINSRHSDPIKAYSNGASTANGRHKYNGMSRKSDETHSNGGPKVNGGASTNISRVNGGASTNSSRVNGGANINGGYIADPSDEMDRITSPLSPPSVTVIGGHHTSKSNYNSYHSQPSHPNEPDQAPSTRSFTMSLKHLLREQDDFCPL
ncbi:uncharacterized protein LOC108675250 [Hyalella azteca]|uniref:Uncharacterized protein LOC108675250 n=1 Tax=Hyalella azteca TaxID=294128 RepID=A0A8B7NYB2_HYAAZ|nr:uncharacterized protein LOC108675250 [Hyalella azteca]